MTQWLFPTKKRNQNQSLIEYILESRNVQNLDNFLNPSASQIHDPFKMYGVSDAVEAILSAVKQKKKIYIHGDFDVDGITATTIMWKYLYEVLGADVMPFIPSRFDDGYGLSESSIDQIIELGANLIISVDCGVKDIEIIERYKDKVDFIISDHHTLLPSESYKDLSSAELKSKGIKIVGEHAISSSALAVVHPQLKDENHNYPFTEISGAVVSYKIVSAINSYTNSDFDMHNLIDLAALGTVCDIMPLIDENRTIVTIGIEKMKEANNKGINALFEVSGSDPKQAQSYHLGYVLGPRLNASGRLESALDAVRLLSTSSKQNASKIAQYLNELNLKRQDLTQKYIDLAEEQIENQKNHNIYVVHGEEWPEGIVGLIAGRLAQKYNRPVLAGSHSSEGIVKGSARSIEEFHVANVLKELSHLLLRHGGHAGAAGFSLSSDNLTEFIESLQKIAAERVTEEHLVPKLNIDSEISFEDANLQVAESLKKLEPFGHKNESPLLSFIKVKAIKPTSIGKLGQHIKFSIVDADSYISAIAFNKFEEYSTLFSDPKMYFDIAGYLEVNEWNGNKSVQFKVREVRKSIDN